MRKISNSNPSRAQSKKQKREPQGIVKTNRQKNHVEEKSQKPQILFSYQVYKETPLLEFLYEKIKKDSRNNIKRYLTNHQVLVNGVMTTQFDFLLVKEDVVQISRQRILEKQKSSQKIDILYEDEELIVINKPSGLLSIESDNEKNNTAYSFLMEHVQKKDKKSRIFSVHRIDKDTSGVLMVAKNENIRNILQHQWQKIVTKREYIAVCEGIFKEKKGTIQSYLRENINHLMYSSSNKDGQFSITHYQVLKENASYSLVDVSIDTGRKNQIRVHMGDLGHKVVGDSKYGPVKDPLHRLGLHAYKLEFVHPIKNKKMCFTAPIPSAFEELFKTK